MAVSEINAQLVIHDIDGNVWLIWNAGAGGKRTFTVVMDLETLEELHRALVARRVKWVKDDRSLGVVRSQGQLVLFFQMRERPYAVIPLRLSEDESDRFVLAVGERVTVE